MAPAAADEVIEMIVSADGGQQLIKLLQYLSKAPISNLAAKTSGGEDPLAILKPAINTLGYLYILAARIEENPRAQTEGLIARVMQLIGSGEPAQLRMDPDKVYQVVLFVAETLRMAEKPSIALNTLRQALLKLASSTDQLTVIHQLFLRQCLVSKSYLAARDMITHDILHFDPATTHVKYQDHLLYHYYAGMIWCGLKDFERATDAFEVAIAMPSNAVSAIQIEAYKKYILASLLHDGKLRQLPRYTANIVLRTAKSACVAYFDYAKAFATLDINKVRMELVKLLPIFENDKNAGLAKQCIDAVMRQNVKELAQIYVTLSLVDIGRKLGFDDASAAVQAENFVVRMIESREIFASIAMDASGSRHGFVTFHDDPSTFNDQSTVDRINANLGHAVDLMDQVNAMETEIAMSKEYLIKADAAHRDQGRIDTHAMFPSGEDFDMMDESESVFA